MSQLQFTDGHRTYRFKLDRQESSVTLALQRNDLDPVLLRAEVQYSDPWILVRTEGRTHRLLCVRDEGGLWVTLEGRTWYLQPARSGAAQVSTAGQDAEVRAPMTGTVVKVLAQPGARVAAGDLLAVMEAMKMEYRLEARAAGHVERVHCQPGDLLNVGALLVELAPESGA